LQLLRTSIFRPVSHRKRWTPFFLCHHAPVLEEKELASNRLFQFEVAIVFFQARECSSATHKPCPYLVPIEEAAAGTASARLRRRGPPLFSPRFSATSSLPAPRRPGSKLISIGSPPLLLLLLGLNIPRRKAGAVPAKVGTGATKADGVEAWHVGTFSKSSCA